MTSKDLPENWKEIIRDGFDDGMSIIELTRPLGISMSSLDKIRKDPDFEDYLQEHKDLAEVWWMGKERTNLENRNFNNHLYQGAMRARYGRTDKLDITSQGEKIKSPIYKLPDGTVIKFD